MRSMLRLLCLGVLFVAAWSLVGADTQGSITGVVYERQGDLLSMVEGADGSAHDEVLFTIGKKGVNNSASNIVPESWSCEPQAGAWRCWGPARSISFFSFQPSGNYRFSNRLELKVNYQGGSLFDRKLDVQSIALPKIENSLEGILETPARIAPGAYFTARPIKAGYEHGNWQARIGDRTLSKATLNEDALAALPSSGRDFRDYAYLTPGVVAEDAEVSFTYDGPWGERLVDAPAPDILIGEPISEDCQPTIEYCPSMAAMGGSICVCGCFPNETIGASLLLDGKPVEVTASSPWVTSVSLAEVEPGRHEITWAPGSGGSGSVDFEAVRVGGKIDKEVIMKGGSADLEFWVDGTRRVIDMDITTLDTNIGIQGGNLQTAMTAGGSPNNILRKLWGNEVGDFNVGFIIDLPPCPCGMLEVDDDSFVRHPISLSGRSNVIWPDGGLTLPIEFNAPNVFGMAPRPPFDSNDLQVRLRQLGMRASAGTFGEFIFETRADEPSVGRFTNVEVSDEGYFRSGDVDFNLRTEFTVPYSDLLPLKVGSSYDFGLDDWSFQGTSEDLGNVDFRGRAGTASNVVFDRIETDKARTLLHGYADFTLRGAMSIKH